MQKNHHYTGLTDAQVVENRKKYGPNVLTPPEKDPWWKDFLEKFTDPIIIILLVALALSTGVSCYEYFSGHEGAGAFLEPLGILVAVLLATVVGFCFEQSANKKFEVLNQVNDDAPVKVIRNGNICQIAKKEVVTGDIVILETGEEIPADGELLEAVSLQINESTLTGEPVAKKTTNPDDFDPEATYPSNQAMKGSTVVDGHGILQVLKVGDASEYGKVFEGAQIDSSVETPLNRQLDKLADLITNVSYGIAVLIIAGRLIWYFAGLEESFDWILFGGFLLKTIMIAVTVIVVAVPEGLPMSVTLSLALSMKRMLSTNNLVRKMHACETMGAATVICTDKTGTLTQNQMKVYDANFCDAADGDGITRNLEWFLAEFPDAKVVDAESCGIKDGGMPDLVKEGIAVNSTAYLDYSNPDKIKALGNPTEGALLLWLHERGVNYLPLRENAEIIEQLTFSTERKYMATLVHSPLFGKKALYVKGAPEIILDLCSAVNGHVAEADLASARATVRAQLLEYQNRAMRTLGFARQFVEDGKEYIRDGKLQNTALTFLGIAAISDPIRADVPDAVRSCLDAGIGVKIVTGDTPGTAKEIGRQIGLWDKNEDESHHLTGAEFAALSDEAVLVAAGIPLRLKTRSDPRICGSTDNGA
jgi:Ca2+-transporting ATPase